MPERETDISTAPLCGGSTVQILSLHKDSSAVDQMVLYEDNPSSLT